MERKACLSLVGAGRLLWRRFGCDYSEANMNNGYG